MDEMTKKEKILCIVVAILIGVIVYLAINDKKKEKYSKCVCSSKYGRDRVCQDSKMSRIAYNAGVTESSLDENQKLHGGPQWTKVSPGNVNYPISEGCQWKNSSTGWDPNGLGGLM